MSEEQKPRGDELKREKKKGKTGTTLNIYRWPRAEPAE
jgi:hypothetical protein